MPDGQKKPRKLTSTETAMLQKIFGTSVDYTLVTLTEGLLTDDEDGSTDADRLAEADGNDLYFDPDWWKDDFTTGNAAADFARRGMLVHEMTHVWQHQNDCLNGGLDRLDTYYREKIAFDCGTLDGIYVQIEIQVRRYLKQYDELSKSEAYELAERQHRKEIDSLVDVIQRNESLYKADKKQYVANQDYDPVITSGPFPKHQTQQILPGAKAPQIPFLPGRVGASRAPLPGERLSDFLWRDAAIRAAFGSKTNLKSKMKKWAESDSEEHSHSLSDYNYLMQPAGSVPFLMLRREAQAALVEDYYYLVSGVDPRTMVNKGDYRTRPPLEFYEMLIPFLPNRAACEN